MIRSFLAAAFVAALGAPAFAADYTIDPNHTQANFTVTHLTISNVSGKIPVTGGAVVANDALLPTSITTTLSVKDLNTESADRDAELRSAQWFDVEKYPTMTFASKSITGTPQAFTAIGELTLHGVTKQVTLAGKLLGKIVDSRGRAHVGYTATTTIDRRDFGLTFAGAPGGNLIAGYDVSVNINVETVAK